MIVSNGDKDRPSHSHNESTLRLPDRVLRRRQSWSSLPDYESSEAQHRMSLGLDTGKPWHRTRIWRSILLGLLAYALLTTAIGVPIIVTKLRNRGQRPFSVDEVLLGNQQPPSSGLVTLADSMACNKWNDTGVLGSPRPYTATLRTQLASTGDISIRSNATTEATRSTVMNGTLTVEYDSETKNKDAQFTVHLQTTTLELQRSVLVCYTDSGINRGLSIFFPTNMTDAASINIDIRLVLPAGGTANPPRIISNFNTYLPNFSQTFRDLKKIQFGTIRIEGTVRPINITNLRAPRISVKNMLGNISGTFNSSEALTLDTIRGAIDASITLVKPPSRSNPTSLTLDTGDHEIKARVTLISSSRSLSSPHFVGKVVTFNGPVNLNISHHQSTSPVPIYFSVQNNLARSKVIMDQKFEGTFIAQTKLANVTIQRGEENPKFDPTGAHKPRTLQIDQKSSSRSSGWIGWRKRPAAGAGQGHIEVASSLSPVELYFGPT